MGRYKTMIGIAAAGLAMAKCGKPSIEDFLGPGVDCKARITMPNGQIVDTTVRVLDNGAMHLRGPLSPNFLRQVREDVEVKVKIYDCKSVKL